MKYLAYIIAFILVLVATGFSLLNAQTIELHYYFGALKLSLSVALLLSLLVGITLGVAMILPRLIQLAYSNRKLRQITQDYESEIRKLRTFPIRDEH